MIIEIKNLGPVASFQFDLNKDLNIIFGKNNIGKSYAITAVYLIIKNLTSDSFKRGSIELELAMFARNYKNIEFGEQVPKIIQEIDEVEKEIAKKLKEVKKGDLDITKEVTKVFQKIISQSFLENLEQSFKNSFTSIEGLTNKYSEEKFSLKITYDSFYFTITNKNNKLIINSVKLNQSIVAKKISSNRKPIIKDNQILIYSNIKLKDRGKINLIENIIGKLYFDFKNEVFNHINKIYFLPASRSGLYQALSTFSAVIAELSKSRNFLTNKIELPNISEPVSDYFLYLSKISSRKINNKFFDIIEKIEEEILNGKVIFNKDTKKIVFLQNQTGTELDLSFTSSMISEIAPIVAFLKYIINDEKASGFSPFMRALNKSKQTGSNLVFIEEPEAHLHPSVQIKLIELFTLLVNKDLKIIMTTHSNYMFNKLSNLILDEKINPEKVGSYLMKMCKTGSISDSVAMRAEEDGMRDENFADVAEQLYEERIAIYDKLNYNADR